MDMFIVPLHTIRCQSGPLTQFALNRFCGLGWRCSLPGSLYASQRFHHETERHFLLLRIQWETRWWKFYASTIYSFWNKLMLSWQILNFAKNWPLTSQNWIKYGTIYKKRTTHINELQGKRKPQKHFLCLSINRSTFSEIWIVTHSLHMPTCQNSPPEHSHPLVPCQTRRLTCISNRIACFIGMFC